MDFELTADQWAWREETAHQLHGGMGYMREFDLHLWSERAKASELLGGPAAVQSRRLERAMSLVG